MTKRSEHLYPGTVRQRRGDAIAAWKDVNGQWTAEADAMFAKMIRAGELRVGKIEAAPPAPVSTWRSPATLITGTGYVLLLWRDVIEYEGFGPRNTRVGMGKLAHDWWAITGPNSTMRYPIAGDIEGWMPAPVPGEVLL